MKAFILSFFLTFTFPLIAQTITPETTQAATEALTDEVVPLDTVVDATVAVVKDGKSMGRLALSVALLNLLVMFLKTNLANTWFSKKSTNYKRAFLLVAGQVLGILLAIQSGLSPLSAVIGGLITSGGAVAIFESVKGLLPKKK